MTDGVLVLDCCGPCVVSNLNWSHLGRLNRFELAYNHYIPSTSRLTFLHEARMQV